MRFPVHVVVDTNVPTTANSMNSAAPQSCVAASAQALAHTMTQGHVHIDDGAGSSTIMAEYLRNLSPSGEPGPGDVFLKWMLTHEWNSQRVTRVKITPRVNDAEDYEELTPPSDGTLYDRSDRKFLAVAAAHQPHPTILQSFDSKWWGWQEALAADGVTITFLCPDAISAKHAAKMGTG